MKNKNCFNNSVHVIAAGAAKRDAGVLTGLNMKRKTTIIPTLACLLFFAGCGEPPTPPKKIEKVYIDQSYYDLRTEEKSLYERSGLTSDDTEVKREAVMDKMTDEFRKRYIGKYIKWDGGYISDVKEEYGNFICKIDMDKGAIFSTADITIPVSKQQAMELKKYKEVLIDGKITDLNGSLKVEIEEAKLSYTGRSLDDMSEEKK